MQTSIKDRAKLHPLPLLPSTPGLGPGFYFGYATVVMLNLDIRFEPGTAGYALCCHNMIDIKFIIHPHIRP